MWMAREMVKRKVHLWSLCVVYHSDLQYCIEPALSNLQVPPPPFISPYHCNQDEIEMSFEFDMYGFYQKEGIVTSNGCFLLADSFALENIAVLTLWFTYTNTMTSGNIGGYISSGWFKYAFEVDDYFFIFLYSANISSSGLYIQYCTRRFPAFCCFSKQNTHTWNQWWHPEYHHARKWFCITQAG